MKNRVIMAAMSRNRSDNGIHNRLMAKYYSERAEDAGIVITESIPVSRIGSCIDMVEVVILKNKLMDGKKLLNLYII